MALTDSMSSSQRASSSTTPSATHLNGLDWVALILMIVGGVNWGLVGAFNFDLVAAIFGSMTVVSRIVYVLVGLAALYGIVMSMKLSRRT